MAQRPSLRPSTRGLYEWLLNKHVTPYIGGVELGKVSTAVIRQWRSDLLKAGVSESVAAKAYRLVRAVLHTAVDEDKILQRNPCQIRGADRENASPRPVITVAQVFSLADSMPRRFRVMILLAAFGSLRFGEVTALRRCDLAEDASSVHITRTHVEVIGKGLKVGPPKSAAGVRWVNLPQAIRRDILEHLETFVTDDPNALLFTGEKSGKAIRRSNWSQRVKWTKVVANLGMPGLHFHDLRHAGNVWASKAGMSTRDLMARMGHDDERAALIYQRATDQADMRIAGELSKMVDKHRKRSKGSTGQSKPKRAKKRRADQGAEPRSGRAPGS